MGTFHHGATISFVVAVSSETSSFLSFRSRFTDPRFFCAFAYTSFADAVLTSLQTSCFLSHFSVSSNAFPASLSSSELNITNPNVLPLCFFTDLRVTENTKHPLHAFHVMLIQERGQFLLGHVVAEI